MARHGLTDWEWQAIEPLLPAERGRRGRPWNAHRRTIDGILWVLTTGAPWRDLPTEFGSWSSIHDRFNRWSRDGTWKLIQRTLLKWLGERDGIDRDLWFIDGSSVRATRAAAGAGKRGASGEPEDHALGRSRGGYGTKFHLVCDRLGVPLTVEVTPGQRHECACFEQTMDGVSIPGRRGAPQRRPRRLGGDRGYSYPRIRAWLRSKRIGVVIPTRRNQQRSTDFDPHAYRDRNVVERCVGWLKEARRVSTRYEKLARNYLSMIRRGGPPLAIVRRLLRLLAREPLR